MSELAWLDYSERERRKALEVIDLFREEETRDELGLGAVRDALADLFFPGTSTIQTRAKYFLFVPWVCQRLEDNQLAGREATQEGRRLQDKLRQALCGGGEDRGVIGFRAGLNVQRLPSSVYWQGLQRWGILKYQGSEDAYRRHLAGFYGMLEAWASPEKGESPEALPANWDPYLPTPPRDWLQKTTFLLKPDEAEYLVDRIQMNFPDSLLAFLLRHRVRLADEAAFPWEQPGIEGIDLALKDALGHARLFSETMHGAALLYNLILAEQVEHQEWTDSYREQIDVWWSTLEARREDLQGWDLSAFWQFIGKLGVRIPLLSRTFIAAWIELSRTSRSKVQVVERQAPRRLIGERERQLKRARVRIGNSRTKEEWNGTSGAAQLDYRWNRPVREIVNDLLGPEGGLHMLDPQERRLLQDALRPPAGYELSQAVLTTYTLDLMTLLSVPLAFTFFQLEDQEGPPTADPLALLEALRRYARRIVLFCQAGQIAVPRRGHLLLGYLENSVFEVTSPRGGVFHPKVAILRFVRKSDPAAAGDAPDPEVHVICRVLCSSRNLTFDRSWDTVLMIEGPLVAHRQKAFSRNHRLADFVSALPRLALRPMDEEMTKSIASLAAELRRVDFEVPEGFDDFTFQPIGIGNEPSWPLEGYDRTVVVSPFVSDGFLKRLCETEGEHRLISRYETLDALAAPSLEGLDAAYYLNPAAEPPEEPEPAEPSQAEAQPDNMDNSGRSVAMVPSDQFNGLHAKLYVADDGWNAHVWTGSANATDAAFAQNVEFLVELVGHKRLCGVEAFLKTADADRQKTKGDRGLAFADLLQRYERSNAPKPDDVGKELAKLLRSARQALATGGLSGEVHPSESASLCYCVTVTSPVIAQWPGGVDVTCRPISLREDAAMPLRSPAKTLAVFDGLSFEAVTAFFAFELTARREKRKETVRFVLNLPLTGLPEDRPGKILMSLLRNREQLLRYLLLLLADDETVAERLMDIMAGQARPGSSDTTLGGVGLPLLEPLLRALDREPGRLDQVSQLVDDLLKTAEGKALLTDEFLAVWRPIWEVRKDVPQE